MKLKVIDMDIATGSALVSILNKKDARVLDIHAMDRIKIKKRGKIETTVINIAESKKAVPPGYIGVYEEVIDSLKLKNEEIVDIDLAKKPISIEFIKKKLDGKILTKKEIDQIVWDIVHNKLNDVELTYFVAACYMRAMTLDETIMLTKAMAKYGETLKLKRYPVIDKHSVGGVPGNRTTMVVVPIIAAAGFTIPKTSSRSITSPAGTADTMEILAKVSFPLKKMKRIVEKTNGCIVWGGALNLAPADDKIIKVERPLRIDAESQLLASIMAKKYSVSSTHILIDIPVGRGSKFFSKNVALKIKKDFIEIGKKLRKHVRVILTDGSQPIGNGIGPALEARDVLYVLTRHKKRPLDLEHKSIMMAGKILEMVKIPNGEELAKELLESGKAYRKMVDIIKAQDGRILSPEMIKIGRFKFTVRSRKSGVVKIIDNEMISRLARVAGAPQDKEAGLYLYKHVGHKARRNEPLFAIYAKNKDKLKYALNVLKDENPFLICQKYTAGL